MIETKEYKYIPATIVHRLTGKVTVEDAEEGIREAVKILDSMRQKQKKINLIIDTKGLMFENLQAHRTWSLWLKTSPAITENVNLAVFVADDSSNARAEKEMLQTEKRKFFFDFEEGINWLKENIGDSPWTGAILKKRNS